MSKIIKVIKLTSCRDCPHVQISRDYTEDSWESVDKWKCLLLNLYVRRYVDWHDKGEFIPKGCPLEDDKEEV